MALFSSVTSEEMIAGLTWSCSLPPGWSIEWDGSLAGADTSPFRVMSCMDFIEMSSYR